MPKINSIPTFLINLDRRADRLEKMIARLGNLPFKRISAIDGQSLNDLEFVSQINQQKMTKNEIACILSHREVWQKIVDNKIPCACILEDDVNLSSSFPNFIRDISWLPDSFDVIKIETFWDRVSLSFKKTKARDRLLRQLGSMHAGSAGYIVSLKGAIKLLNIAQHLDRPLDHLMFEVKTTRSEFRVMQLSPALCIQEEVLLPDVAPSSDITNDRRIRQSQKTHGIHKLWREIKRPYFQILGFMRLIKEKLIIVRYVPFI